ncbi:ABC transporter ATP-binding protein [Paenibacillus sp. UNC451MF]|uniref:ABC transporter ATP-binding protein n=1 Tax=Paenibacillus sp. UNC451MF TaxID=1449063 RepID=UPI00048B0CE2|nr:ABC transporter ATP-binding protein [Paenibacillus sp. UNC451MF]
MWKLFRFLKPYWKSALLAPLLMLVEVYMDLLQPKLMASIVNEGVLQKDLLHIQKTGALMIGFTLIGLIGGLGCTLFSSLASQNFGADVRNELFQKVQSFSFRNLDQFKAGSLVTRLTNDVVQMQNLVQMTLRILVRAPFLAIGSLIMAVTISYRLAAILAVVIPVLFLVLYLLIRFAFPLFSKVQSKLDSVNNVLQENLAGIRVVKAFVRSDYENKRFRTANNDYTEIAMKATRIVALNMPVMTLILNASIVAVLWYGGNLTWEGSLPVGDLIAFVNYVTQVLFSLLMVGMMLMFVSRAKASADRINEVMEVQSEITEDGHAVSRSVRAGEVTFEHVSFAYNGEESTHMDSISEQRDLVLKDIHFTAEPGQTVAILGATGSGKSTLVNLIPRLYDTTKGNVLIDGIDIRQMSLDHLRNQVGMVLQQAILFTGTIRDNIRFGKPDASQEEVEEAAKAAQAHDFIMSMPEGYDTELGQRGVNLSGGQKQRISIARALLVRPAVLILDDSTSAVDLGTESRIQAAIKSLMRESTCFVIAQRISSVLDADKILVLDEGRIVAEGTHQELIQTSPEYQDIYNSQIGKGAVAHG